jgi:hypothetical protein
MTLQAEEFIRRFLLHVLPEGFQRIRYYGFLANRYRERADAENIYDELKNQWGWNGFTTRKLAPCRLMANMVALVYNWWHLYVRLYDAEHHREAITSRPALLGGVARMTRHSGQSTIKVRPPA